MQVSSLSLGAPTLSLVPSPPASTTAPRPQEIPQGCWDVCLPSSAAASCFRGRSLVHHQQGSVSIAQQVRARCLPMADRGRPAVFYQAHWGLPPITSFTFCASSSVDLHGDTKISGAQQNCGPHATIQRATLTDLQSIW